ncbi:MAG: hypothetical protein JO199_00720 [Candidatus Eremiobacteraeota bacterium]|nr:hypothetical protein [Candidatus Eremiobacteraeota bacterium]
MIKYPRHIAFSVLSALLAGCGVADWHGSNRSILPSDASAKVQGTVNYRVLYTFRGGNDGKEPYSAPIAVGGLLYGTTGGGGGNSCNGYGCGTVYSLDTAGNEHLIYRFVNGGNDGAGPLGGLVYYRGWFYDTTVSGGDGTRCGGSGCGTVLAVSGSGQERVLYRFPGGAGGAFPYDGLVALSGVFYGMTSQGGNSVYCFTDQCGTVFKITSAGKESILHRFTGAPDGFGPMGTLVALQGGSLFGTTEFGGAGGCCGTVFSIMATGAERVIYRFKPGYIDGESPAGTLTYVRGVLYGTTQNGGNTFQGQYSRCGYDGCGTVFSVTQTGTESIVYRFQGNADGSSPLGTLVWDGSKFYGTTPGGGVVTQKCPQGCGTVFSVTPSGVEQVLYRFQDGSDGGYPGKTLTMLNGTLYGVTTEGGGPGCGRTGCGTVFALKPP